MTSKPEAEIQRTPVGSLDAVQIQLADADGTILEPKILVVLCHGYGAGGEDLVPCAGEILSCLPHELRPQVRFFFPAAPIILGEMYGMDSRAWWPIDMVELERAMQTGTYRKMRDNDIPEMDTAGAKLLESIQLVLDQQKLGWDACVVGGFSQGSMITTDLTLRNTERPAGLIVWSGTVIREPKWQTALKQRPLHLPVVQSHGRQDSILPFQGAELLRDLLTEGKADVQFLPFDGPHTISPEAITAAAQLIANQLMG